MFLHINSLVVWVMALLSVAIIVMMLKKHLDTEPVKRFVYQVIRIFNAITYPSSIIVLISGICILSFVDSTNSLWFNYMEMVGTTIVPVNIILLFILGKRVTTLLAPKTDTTESITTIELRVSTYLSAVFLIIALILSVILIVGFKI